MNIELIKNSSFIEFYFFAKSEVENAGYSWEIEWQKEKLNSNFSESDLLRETAWVILCSGFRETAVSKVFDYISLCFCDWESAKTISENREVCVTTALAAFRNTRKINAIASLSEVLDKVGFENIQQRILNNPIQTLSEFPYVGQITSWHLAKNLGLDVAKNDRHLSRLAEHYSFSDANELCMSISLSTGENVAVIDIILWRFISMFPKTLLAA